MDAKYTERKKGWFNREVFGFGLTSLLSDLSHEVATTILPLFLAFLGAPTYAVGLIEGVSDGLASLGKYVGGWVSDQTKDRKPLALLGYSIVAVTQGLFGLCMDWTHVFSIRALGWFGRGWRSPIHDALFHDAVPAENTGKAFGFERTMDTIGAILAPLLAFWLLPKIGFGNVFFLTWIPGFLTVAAFAYFIKDRRMIHKDYSFSFFQGLKKLPKNYRFFLAAVTLFGFSDFSNSLLIFWATAALKPSYGVLKASSTAILLYGFHNITYGLTAYPAGWIADKIGKFKVLTFSYFLACFFYIGLMFAGDNLFFLFFLFGLRGVFLGIEHTLERAITGDLLTSDIKGMGYGVLAGFNGLGDFFSSVLVGFLLATNYSILPFGYCFVMALSGAIVMMKVKNEMDYAI